MEKLRRIGQNKLMHLQLLLVIYVDKLLVARGGVRDVDLSKLKLVGSELDRERWNPTCSCCYTCNDSSNPPS